MATIHQIDANRRNAQKSTGPRTPRGKARSSMNALKSGVHARSEIIPGERAASLNGLAAYYVKRFAPATPEERYYVDILIRDDWRQRRLAKADTQVWLHGMENTYTELGDNPLGQVLVETDTNFLRLQSRIDSTERSYRRALHELQRLQTHPANTPAPQVGFVPSNLMKSSVADDRCLSSVKALSSAKSDAA